MSHRRVGSYSKVHLAALLDRGELVGVAPGGGRECLLDTECSVLWHNRWRGQGHLYRDTHSFICNCNFLPLSNPFPSFKFFF